MQMKKNIIIAVVAITTMYQVMSTYSVCNNDKNIHMIYQVKPGESINTVARKFGTTTAKLKELNGVEGAVAGDRLKVE